MIARVTGELLALQPFQLISTALDHLLTEQQSKSYCRPQNQPVFTPKGESMEERTNPKKAKHALLVSMLLLSISSPVSIRPVISAELQQTSPAETPGSPNVTTTVPEQRGEKTAHSPGEAASMRVYINPNTGEILEPSVGALATEAPESREEAFSTSSEGLVETPSPVPGGGIILDLQGRFHSPLVATKKADGKISIEHSPVVPNSCERK